MLSSSTDPLEILTDALREKRPLVLFAGQGLDSSHDAILNALLDRFGCTNRNPGWRAALDQGISASDMAWLSERFDRSVLSDAAAPIFDVAWSSVFTSSIDPRFARRFETRGRQPERVLSRDAYASVPLGWAIQGSTCWQSARSISINGAKCCPKSTKTNASASSNSASKPIYWKPSATSYLKLSGRTCNELRRVQIRPSLRCSCCARPDVLAL